MIIARPFTSPFLSLVLVWLGYDVAVRLLNIEVKCQRITIAMFKKWEQEDDAVISNQEAKIEALREQLDAEKKAHQLTRMRDKAKE